MNLIFHDYAGKVKTMRMPPLPKPLAPPPGMPALIVADWLEDHGETDDLLLHNLRVYPTLPEVLEGYAGHYPDYSGSMRTDELAKWLRIMDTDSPLPVVGWELTPRWREVESLANYGKPHPTTKRATLGLFPEVKYSRCYCFSIRSLNMLGSDPREIRLHMRNALSQMGWIMDWPRGLRETKELMPTLVRTVSEMGDAVEWRQDFPAKYLMPPNGDDRYSLDR